MKALESLRLSASEVQVTQPDFDTNILQKVNKMLKDSPRNASSICLSIWRTLKPISVEEMHTYWALIDQKDSMLDLKNCVYEEW